MLSSGLPIGTPADRSSVREHRVGDGERRGLGGAVAVGHADPGAVPPRCWSAATGTASPPAQSRPARPGTPGPGPRRRRTGRPAAHIALRRCSAISSRSTTASISPRGATTAQPPDSSGTQTSKVLASKAVRSAPARGRLRRTAGRWPGRATSAWVTATPLGTPVDPEVYMTYASCPGGARQLADSRAARRRRVPVCGASRPPSTVTTSVPLPTPSWSLSSLWSLWSLWSLLPGDERTAAVRRGQQTPAPASASMNAIRSAGYSAQRHVSAAGLQHAEQRHDHVGRAFACTAPTGSSGPRPGASAAASRSTGRRAPRRSASGRRRRPPRRVRASGPLRLRTVGRPRAVGGVRLGAPVSFHGPRARRARSSGSTGTADSRGPRVGGGAPAAANQRPAIRSAVAASNRSAA